MRGTKDDKRIGCYGRGWRPVLVPALILAYCIVLCGRVKACEVQDVWLYVAATEGDAITGAYTSLFLCEADTPYWFRVKWKHLDDYGDGPFHVVVQDVTKDVTLWEDDDIEDEDEPDRYRMEEVKEVSSPPSALTEGPHEIKANAYRKYEGEWQESEPATVAFRWSFLNFLPKNYVPNFSCPGGGCTGLKGPTYDYCGNQLKITCSEVEDICAYRYWYKASGAPSWTQIGWCCWEGPAYNRWYYWWNEQDTVFIKTMHVTFNGNLGVDSKGEGCPNYYCFRVEKWDYLNNTSGVWWRRTTDDSFKTGEGFWDENSGVPCPNSVGIHRGHPD